MDPCRKASRLLHVCGHGQASPSPQTATLPKSSEEIERCVIASFRIAESMGFKGDFRQWEDLLWIGELRLLASRKVVQTKLQGRAGFAWPVFATADCPPLPGRA